MRKAEISGARTKKVLLSRKLGPPRWRVRTHRRMSNRRPTRKAKCGSEALRELGPPNPLRHRLPAISSRSFLGYVRVRRLRPRHLHRHAGVEQHQDEHPIRTIATVHLVGSASNRTTLFVL